MPVTHVGIVYRLADKEVLRVIIPDSKEQLDGIQFITEDEGFYKMPLGLYNAQQRLDDLLGTLAPILGNLPGGLAKVKP